MYANIVYNSRHHQLQIYDKQQFFFFLQNNSQAKQREKQIQFRPPNCNNKQGRHIRAEANTQTGCKTMAQLDSQKKSEKFTQGYRREDVRGG